MKTELDVMYDGHLLYVLCMCFHHVSLQSQLLIRLADGPDSLSGRVEIRQFGVWGTVCDDDFGPEEAAVSDKLSIIINVFILTYNFYF